MTLIPLLPPYNPPKTLSTSDTLPCHSGIIDRKPIEHIINELHRQTWTEGLYVRKQDLDRVRRYKNRDGNYKNDFDAGQFLGWIKTIEENTVLCDMENKDVGKGVFVARWKKLPKGTFIPSSGIIKLAPTEDELATKVHCSALQDFNTPIKAIYGFIDPAQQGGILDFINHAPDKNEMANFNFKTHSIKARVAVSNLKSTIKFYNGYAIMGLEVMENIDGGNYGKQLLWSYARSSEYLDLDDLKSSRSDLLLFDSRDEHNGEIINPIYYSLRNIDIFVDTGELIIQQVASLTRWEIMEDPPDSEFIISMDFDSANQSKTKSLLIEKAFLQTYLKMNPLADRIILEVKKE